MTRSARKSALSLAALGAVLVLVLGTPAQGGHCGFGNFVSSTGSDTPQCGEVISSPCASFEFALTQVNTGCEIIVLNAGRYGAQVTISQSVSISNDGAGEAAIDVLNPGPPAAASASPSTREQAMSSACAVWSSMGGALGQREFKSSGPRPSTSRTA